MPVLCHRRACFPPGKCPRGFSLSIPGRVIESVVLGAYYRRMLLYFLSVLHRIEKACCLAFSSTHTCSHFICIITIALLEFMRVARLIEEYGADPEDRRPNCSAVAASNIERAEGCRLLLLGSSCLSTSSEPTLFQNATVSESRQRLTLCFPIRIVVVLSRDDG